MTTRLALLAVFCALPAFAAGTPTPDAALVNELIREAKPLVRSFSRPVSIYHWTHRSDVQIPIKGEVSVSDPHFGQYLERRYHSFYKPDPRNGSMLGTGLYGAIDPSSTRTYGGRNWVLYQLEFKKGARFLDVSGTVPLSTDLTTRMTAFGCAAYNLYSIFSSDSTPACEALRIALADSKELNVQALRYPYSAATLDGCSRSARSAFLVWGGRDFSASVAYIEEIPSRSDPLHDQRVLLQQVYLKDPATRLSSSGKGATPYPSLINASPRVKAEDWMKTHLMGCGHYAEDK